LAEAQQARRLRTRDRLRALRARRASGES
jgi:hypothetical protein